MVLINSLLIIFSSLIISFIILKQAKKHNSYLQNLEEELTMEFLEDSTDDDLLRFCNKAHSKQLNNQNPPGVYENYIFDIQQESQKICIKIIGVRSKQSFKYIRNIRINGANSNNDRL